MQNHLEWNELDVDDAAWHHQVSALDVAAVANSYPLSAPSHGLNAAAGENQRGIRTLQITWRPLLAGAVVIACTMVVIAYAGWHTAQQGLARIQADVASVVKLETLRSRARKAPTVTSP